MTELSVSILSADLANLAAERPILWCAVQTWCILM